MVNVTSTYYHLALFICHLFIDGQFRTAHFVYKSSTFDSDLLLQIDKLCPARIPSYSTDLTLPWEWPWNRNDNINTVLQLNILSSNNLTGDIDELENGFAYYRVFCFASIDAMDSNQQTSIFATLRDLTNSKNLIVYYNAQNASIFIDPIAANFHSNPKLVYVVNRDANYRQVNLFDQTFGEFERTQSIAVRRIISSIKKLHGVEFSPIFHPEVLRIQYYHLHLKNAFIYMTWVDYLEHPPFETNRYCLLQPSNYYKELTYKYQCTENQNS